MTCAIGARSRDDRTRDLSTLTRALALARGLEQRAGARTIASRARRCFDRDERTRAVHAQAPTRAYGAQIARVPSRAGDNGVTGRRDDSARMGAQRAWASAADASPESARAATDRKPHGVAHANAGTSFVVATSEPSDDKLGTCAPVAQLDRAAGFEPVGRGFDSLRAHQSIFSRQSSVASHHRSR